MRDAISKIPDLMRDLYAVVEQLERLFPGRHFTPDGHLVGSLGEVWAAYLYGIDLATASTATHDGRAPDGRSVQIKATQGRSIGLSSESDYLIVFKLRRGGEPSEIYNGPGAEPWVRAGKLQRNGQRSVQLTTLARLAAAVPIEQRIPRVEGLL